MSRRARAVGSSAGPLFALIVVACGTEHVRLLEPELVAGAGGASATRDAGPIESGGTHTFDTGGAESFGTRTFDAGRRLPPDLGALRRAACSRWTADSTPDPALLMLVVDVSGSMTFPDPTSNGMISKWGVERPILSSTLDDFPSTLGVGVLFYPNKPTPANTMMRPASTCINVNAMIPVAYLGTKGSQQRYTIQRSLASTEPNTQQGTPTLDAYLVALQQLGSTTLGGSRQILLITDGQPTFAEGCVGTGTLDVPVDETPIIQAVSQAKRAGIRTFVIGSPGSEQGAITGVDARPWLSRAAEAGGTARPGCSDSGPRYCHFDMVDEPNFGAGLTAALDDIGGSLVSCDVPIPSPPMNERFDPNQVNVVLTTRTAESLLSRDDTARCADGWQYSQDRRHITLCTNTCNLVRSDPGAKLEVLVGCASVMR
jgi:hypothetical protein